MEIKFGRAKHFDNIKLKHVLQYPIWVTAHDDRHDEEYEKPIINADDVTEQIDRLGPIITFKVDGYDNLYGTGYYYHEENYLFSISLWLEDHWVAIEDFNDLVLPVTFEAIPKIFGVPNAKFVCKDRNGNRAFGV